MPMARLALPPPPVAGRRAAGKAKAAARAKRGARGGVAAGPLLALPALPAMPGLGPFGAAAMPGFGFPPAPPPAKKKGSKSDLLDAYYERWIDLSMEPFAAQVPMEAGTVVEIATTDANGTIDGTALLMVRQKYPPDTWGVFMEVAYAGASSPVQCVSLQQGFSAEFPAGTGPYLLHWCAGPAAQCMGNAGHKQALHAMHLRIHRASSVKEAWAVDLKALRRKLTDQSDDEDSDGNKDKVR